MRHGNHRKESADGGSVRALVGARHEDPFSVLGPHEVTGGVVIRALVPGALRVEVVAEDTGAAVGALECRHAAGLFEGAVEAAGLVRLYAARPQGRRQLGGARPLPLPPVLGEWTTI